MLKYLCLAFYICLSLTIKISSSWASEKSLFIDLNSNGEAYQLAGVTFLPDEQKED